MGKYTECVKLHGRTAAQTVQPVCVRLHWRECIHTRKQLTRLRNGACAKEQPPRKTQHPGLTYRAFSSLCTGNRDIFRHFSLKRNFLLYSFRENFVNEKFVYWSYEIVLDVRQVKWISVVRYIRKLSSGIEYACATR